jgi:hypothetical protein
MPHQEKRAWIMLAVTVAAYSGYAAIIVSRADRQPLAGVRYAPTMLWSIVVSAVNPRASRVKDVRDRQIGRLGDYTGQAFVVIGAVAAMLMAMARWQPFWIANVIYLGFALSAVLSSIAKIVLYHRSVPQW